MSVKCFTAPGTWAMSNKLLAVSYCDFFFFYPQFRLILDQAFSQIILISSELFQAKPEGLDCLGGGQGRDRRKQGPRDTWNLLLELLGGSYFGGGSSLLRGPVSPATPTPRGRAGLPHRSVPASAPP